MSIESHVTLIQNTLTRQEILEVWLKRNDKTYAAIGRSLGVSRHSAIRLCRGDSVPSYRHKQMAELGIPVELLPPALDIAPGPKPKSPLQRVA